MKNASKKRVVVGLSGGVDSAIAAYLCKKAGYDVVALFMKNWHDEGVTLSKECPWLEDSQDALQVADHLGIPFQTIDLSQEYREAIVDYMFLEYERGRTPNPDVLCNREIKFKVFLERALELDADFVATGHYCRKDVIFDKAGNPIYRLLAGKDPSKDQSYFLCQLTQQQLSRALFPVGEMLKSEVRDLARTLGLAVAEKKDSQGLCFIGKVSLPDFLQQELGPKKGAIMELDAKNGQSFTRGYHAPLFKLRKSHEIGEHQGAHYFTVGQRKGLGVGGSQEPRYVVATDTKSNTVYVAAGDDHPALYREGLFVKREDIHWIRADLEMKIGEERDYIARIRYRQKLQEVSLSLQKEGLYFRFKEAQRAIASGQFVAWYDGEELVGSGVIN